MRLTGRDLLDEFGQHHGDAKKALDSWTQVVEKAQFKRFMEFKESFPSADYVKPFTVFDIHGDRYRLAAVVNYGEGLVLVKAVMTHKEYDRGRWRDI